jgi:hypothetical protein
LELDVDDSDFFFELDDEPSELVDPDVSAFDEADEPSDFAASFDPLSEVSLPELPLERLEPLRLSFL